MKVETSLQALFTSQTRSKLINIFFSQPKEIFYVRQLVRLTGEEINSVRRELQKLTRINLILPENRGNRLYYSTNSRHPFFTPLLTIAYKNLPGLSELSKADAVVASFSFLTWQVAKSNTIDVIVVGDFSQRQVETAMNSEEKRRGVEFNYMLMDKSELRLRQNKRDPFLVDFFLSGPVVIIGNPVIFTQD